MKPVRGLAIAGAIGNVRKSLDALRESHSGYLDNLNADDIAERIAALIVEANPKVVAIDMQGVIDLEYSALKMLTEAEKRRRESGVSLWLVEMSSQVLATVKRAPLGETLGREGMLHSLEIAVERYRAMQTL